MNKQQQERIANYLGLAQRAGCIAAGDAPSREALNKGRACLLVLAGDAAPKVRAELLALAGDKVPALDWPDMYDLGRLVGKSRRGALALCDAGFAKAIAKVLKEEEKYCE